jgi:hypothetical protein
MHPSCHRFVILLSLPQTGSVGRIVFRRGDLNVAGDGRNQSDGPCDAEKNGGYTGQTAHFKLSSWRRRS